MSDAATTHRGTTSDTGRTAPAGRSAWAWGAAGFVLAAFVIIAGNTNLDPGENGGTPELVVSLLVCAAVAVALFGWLVPGSTNPGRTAVIFVVLAVVALLAFWSGLPAVLAPAAMALAVRSGTDTRSRVVLGVGAVVCLLMVAAGIVNLVD
jgi:cytochrome bd-type quinol oxidase subunit 2